MKPTSAHREAQARRPRAVPRQDLRGRGRRRTFDTDDASDPHLRVRASWRAPDGTTIFPQSEWNLREAEPSCESDPQLPEDQIYALLLGGSPARRAAAAPPRASASAPACSASPERHPSAPRGATRRQRADARRRTYSTYTAAVQITDEISIRGQLQELNANEPTEHNEPSAAPSTGASARTGPCAPRSGLSALG